MACNHIWRDTSLPTPKQTVAELLESVKKSGACGWWLQGIEYDLASELIDNGLVRMCEECKNNGYTSQAIFVINNDKD